MSGLGALRTRLSRIGAVAGRLPAAVAVAVVYVAARAVTLGFLLAAADLSGPTSRFGEAPPLSSLLMGWDAQWYWTVAVYGYPTDLPVTAAGTVAENAWAFMPVYPWLSDALGTLVGGYTVAAPLLSLCAGYAASLALYALLRPHLGRGAALWAVVLFAAGPLAALFHVGYAESLFLLWLFLALLAVERRRWWWLYGLVPLLAFTRPGVLAFSLFLALYGIWRWFRRRREALPVREIVHIVATGLWAAVLGLAWPVITGVVTGRADAYLQTELAWRRAWLGGEEGFVPFSGFVHAAAMWFRLAGLPEWTGIATLIVVVIAIGLLLWCSPQVRRLGMPLRLWAASYLVYLLAVFFPQSSTFRLLVPLSPLWGAVAVPRSWWWRGGTLAVVLALQWWWIYNMYALANTFTQVP